ncbi:MAG: HAMP domain-containing sensor histidine kinase [Motilibacteraceae bacterium]
MTGPGAWRGSGLGARLFTAQTLTALVGAATLWLVAAIVGPPLFRQHLHRAAGHVDAETSRHVEEAFASASALAIGVALLASLAAAVAVSAYVSRRIAAPVARLAAAAHGVADGRFDVHVPDPALGPEFDTLTASFNAMAQRLQAVETTRRRLLGDLAHEMRTPVSTVDAYLEGLEDGVVTVDADTLAMLRTQTARLARLSDDVTAVSRAEEHQLDLHPMLTRPADLVSSAIAEAADRYAAAGVDLFSQLEAALPQVDVDPERMGQVLGNLLDNALRHTSACGRVTLTARATAQYVEIEVRDTGEGIPAEHIAHLFERFYRVDTARDRAHGGSGIGLAIVKALVQAHGGTVTAGSSGPGQGARFTVRLPAAARHGQRDEPR